MSTNDSVPTIDISRFTHGTASERDAVVRQVAETCERIGFFLIEGHGVADDLIARTYASARTFFDLPKKTRSRWRRRCAT